MASGRKPRTTKAKAADAPVEIRGIKGFDANLKCRGYQFEVGKTYEHEGPTEVCRQGFHACTQDAHPLQVLQYYAPAGSRFCEVIQSGQIATDDNIKIASTRIAIGCEITISDLTHRAVKWVLARTKKSEGASKTGDYGAASATGDYGAASATGDYGAASATGDCGAASATGSRGAASATGDYGAASATGDYGAASATGFRGAASATGDYGAASATGTSGAASATGDGGAASATGTKSAAMTCGYDGRVRGGNGNALFCLERDRGWNIVSTASGIVGRDGIKPGTWYACKSGELVECDK